jgi:hypothetical protein
MGHFPRPIIRVLGAIKLLALAKLSSGIKPITMGKVFYRLVNRPYVFNFGMSFVFICHLINLVW